MVRRPDLRTVDQLRDRLDRGLTGEKIPHPDPALAPLGTDAEAGGQPPTRAELKLEAAALQDNPRTSRWPDDIQGLMIYAVAVAAFASAVVTVILLAR